MNVYMINSGNNGCCYVRTLLPAFANGFLTDKSSVRSGHEQDSKQIQADLQDADVVVFHRPERQEFLDLMGMLKRDGKVVVVDNDDTFKIADKHPLAEWTSDAMRIDLKSRDNFFDKAAKMADLLTTTNEFLADEYRKINDNVAVLPNCVDPMDWDEPLRNETHKVRIGIVGSVSYAYDYGHIRDVLRILSDRDNVQLVLFGLGDARHQKNNPIVTEFFKNEYDFWGSLNIEQIPWCDIADYPTLLNEARLDMMLIPRRENYFNKCKSNIKFLEAAMCEIPCIMQSFDNAPYENLKKHKLGKADEDGLKCGVFIENNNRWMKEIDELINDKSLRRRIGQFANGVATTYYNIENNAHLWAEAYEKIFNQKQEASQNFGR